MGPESPPVAVGLLKGYKATSHWATLSVLPLAGAQPMEARVVRDRNRIAGAGVSAGLDLGLIILALLRDQNDAETTQLLADTYAPNNFSRWADWTLTVQRCVQMTCTQNPNRLAVDSTLATSAVAFENSVPGARASSASRMRRWLINSPTWPATR